VNPKLTHRPATDADLDLLAEWNYQLIRDEGQRNLLTLPELRERMQGWLAGKYRARLFFVEAEPVAYCVFNETESEIYLRHFFVRRDRRRLGIGQAALALLIQRVWPRKRLTVEVLCRNEAALNFWKAVGYTEYSLCLVIPAQD
jgi:GNAT superfamily N-acetyltransferase